MLPLNKGELRLLTMIAESGRSGTWTLLHGPDLGRRLATVTGTSRSTAFRAVSSLVSRGLIERGVDEHHRTTLTLTDRLYEGAYVVLQRKKVETLVGAKDWAYLQGNDELADVIHERAMDMPPGRYRDQVRSVTRTLVRAKQGVNLNTPDYGGHRKRNVVELPSPRSGTHNPRSATHSRRNGIRKLGSTR